MFYGQMTYEGRKGRFLSLLVPGSLVDSNSGTPDDRHSLWYSSVDGFRGGPFLKIFPIFVAYFVEQWRRLYFLTGIERNNNCIRRCNFQNFSYREVLKRTKICSSEKDVVYLT